MEAVTQRSMSQPVKFSITDAKGTAAITPELRQEIEQGLPARIFGADRLLQAAENSARINQDVRDVLPKLMFLLLPVFALLTRLAWRRRMPRYPAHLYLALHLHAAWFGVAAIVTLVAGAIGSTAVATLTGVAAIAYSTWYGLAAVRRVFRESWSRTIAKAAAASIAYGVCLVVMSLLMLAYVLMRL